MTPPISPCYFCAAPESVATRPKEDVCTTGCVTLKESETNKYFETKAAYGEMQINLVQEYKNSLTPDAFWEATIINWLISRETGYRALIEKTPDEKVIEVFTSKFASNPSLPRVKFWRAKIAMILVSDIDNPNSRDFLTKLKFTGTNIPVFGVVIPGNKTKFTNADKLGLLQQVYDNLLDPKLKTSPHDDLLEAECLAAQYELRASNSNSHLAPSRDIAYINARLNAVLSINPKSPPKYVKDRIESTYYNTDADFTFFYGRDASKRESYRYIADANKIKARLLLLRSDYNDPALPDNLNQAIALFNKAESLVDDYIESPVKVNETIRKLYAKHGIKGHPSFNKHYSDLLNIVSIEQLKAGAYLRLGLYNQLRNPAESANNFKLAATICETTIKNLEAIKKDYLTRKETKNPQQWMKDPFLWRPTLLSSAKTLLSSVFLAQDTNIERAKLLVEDVAADKDKEHLTRGEEEVRIRLALVDAYLRQKPLDQKGQTAKVRAAEAALPNENDPLAKPLAGPIRLAQAKVLMAQYGLDNSRQEIPEKIIALLDEPIAQAGTLTATKPGGHPPQQKPHNGVFEDYELAAALQLRAEAHFALDHIKEAKRDFVLTQTVYKDDRGISLNPFAELGQADIANWSGQLDEAERGYHKLLDDFGLNGDYAQVAKHFPSLKSIKLQVELGLREVALRRQTLLHPGEYANTQANALIAQAVVILKTSDEVYMIERALQSYLEAVISKKEHGAEELAKLAESFSAKGFNVKRFLGELGQERDIEIKAATEALLTIKLAEGYLFLSEFVEAKSTLKEFEKRYQPVLAARPEIKANFDLTSIEIALRQHENAKDTLKNLKATAAAIFAMPPDKRDPYLCERAVKDLVDLYVDQNDFNGAIAVLIAAREPEKRTISAESHGKLNAKKLEAALAEARQITSAAGAKGLAGIFDYKNLTAKWALLDTELQIKTAEVLSWAKNYDQALADVNRLEKPSLKILHQVRLKVLRANIYLQSYSHQNYAEAETIYGEAEKLAIKLTNSQEGLAVKIELVTNHANLINYRSGYKKGDVLAKAEKYYYQALTLIGLLKDKKLERASKSHVYFGLGNLRNQQELPLQAEAYFRLAAAHMDALPPEEQAQINASKGAQNQNPVSVKETMLIREGRVEHQQVAEVPIPVYKNHLGALYLLLRTQADEAKNLNIFSIYVGPKGQLSVKDVGTFQMACLAKVYSGVQRSDPTAAAHETRRPDFLCEAGFSSKFVNVNVSGTFDATEEQLNVWRDAHLSTVHAEAMFNFAWLNIKGFNGLSAGPSFDWYKFFYGGQLHENKELAWVSQWRFDFGALPNSRIPYNTVYGRIFLGWPTAEWRNDNDLSPSALAGGKTGDQFKFDPANLSIGGELCANIVGRVKICGEYKYKRQTGTDSHQAGIKIEIPINWPWW